MVKFENKNQQEAFEALSKQDKNSVLYILMSLIISMPLIAGELLASLAVVPAAISSILSQESDYSGQVLDGLNFKDRIEKKIDQMLKLEKAIVQYEELEEAITNGELQENITKLQEIQNTPTAQLNFDNGVGGFFGSLKQKTSDNYNKVTQSINIAGETIEVANDLFHETKDFVEDGAKLIYDNTIEDIETVNTLKDKIENPTPQDILAPLSSGGIFIITAFLLRMLRLRDKTGFLYEVRRDMVQAMGLGTKDPYNLTPDELIKYTKKKYTREECITLALELLKEEAGEGQDTTQIDIIEQALIRYEDTIDKK